MAYVSIEVDLGEFETDDLVAELAERGEAMGENANIAQAIGFLENEGCPKEIADALREWASAPLCTSLTLADWKAGAGVDPEPVVEAAPQLLRG